MLATKNQASMDKPFLEMKCIPYDVETKKDCEFDWDAEVSEGGDQLLMKIKFKNPPAVSQNDGNDDVLIMFWGAPELKSASGEQVYAYSQLKRITIPK